VGDVNYSALTREGKTSFELSNAIIYKGSLGN
jgi:hypothetical protein